MGSCARGPRSSVSLLMGDVSSLHSWLQRPGCPEACVCPLVGRGGILGWLTEGPKVSQSWCWHAGEWGQGSRVPCSGACLLFRDLGTDRLQVSCPPTAGWGQSPGDSTAGAHPLVGETLTWD